MDPDIYQRAWRTHSSQTRVTIDAEFLLKEMQRNQRDFRATIFRRDFLEVGLALLMTPFWCYAGIALSLPWTWYLTIPVLVWIAGFMLVYRLRHRQPPGNSDDPLLQCGKRSLREVEDQIWLLRNVFWWYLLPPSLSIMAFFVHVALLNSADWHDAIGYAYLFIFVAMLYSFVYWLNQRAVDVTLEPRRQELLALIAGLGDESEGQVGSETESMPTVNPKRRRRSSLAVAALCLAALVAIALGIRGSLSSYDQPPRSSGPGGEALASQVRDLRNGNGLVGLAAMVMVDGRIEAAAAYGERKKGSGISLEISDRWHVGGITKSVTATMIARLVESGEMQWTDSIEQAFTDAEMHPQWKPVTLLQLLTDTAGAPVYFSDEVSRQRPSLGPESTRLRREAVLGVIANAPLYVPGERNLYSNVGYSIAAAMAEQVTGVSWSELVRREVFEPLELKDAGFGPPESPSGTLPQPRGHRIRLLGKAAASDEADNTAIMGPAGIVHMSLTDLCTFATEHLRGDLGEGKLLASETYKLLHTGRRLQYACGWLIAAPTYDIPQKMYWHNGSNTMWYALVAFIPDKNMVVAVTSNDGDMQQAESAAWEIVKTVARQIDPDGDAYHRQSLPSSAFPKKSPFAAVRWKSLQPEVMVDGQWFQLLAVDDIDATEIVSFCRQAYDSRWQKRFEEDLIEVLARMGHPTADTVDLKVRSVASSMDSILQEVLMTSENRDAIRQAAQARAIQQP